MSSYFSHDFVTFLDIFGHLLRSCCFRLSRRPAIREAANMIMMKIITSDNNEQNYWFSLWQSSKLWLICPLMIWYNMKMVLDPFQSGWALSIRHNFSIWISFFPGLTNWQCLSRKPVSEYRNCLIHLKVGWQLNIELTALYSEPSQLLRSKPVFHFSVTSNIKPFFLLDSQTNNA